MRHFHFVPCLLALIAPLGVSCGPDKANEPETVVKLKTSAPVCVGQKAVVPESGIVERMYQVTREQARRTEMPNYVSYAVEQDELFAYFSFPRTLPAQPTTQEIRSQLKYAYVRFSLDQPAEFGGHLEIVSPSTTFSLNAFEQLEVQDGNLVFRVSRANPGHYSKWLSIYDEDTTNDPPADVDCILGDIRGQCVCEFSGPPLVISLSGSLPL